MNVTTISDAADAVLVDEEGDVLRAYRCPAGVWSISTGLTAASGVIKPKAGMVITREESKRLRRLALAQNYEPRVAKALPTDKQHVFDGAVLWDWNTGAILKASWVKLFRQGAVQQARQSFLSWVKAGGKTLPGLVKRRNREWNIIEFANYGAVSRQPVAISNFADHAADFRKLGYDISLGATVTIQAFQRQHGLTVDGIIGPATRAQLQRALSAKASNTATIGGATAGAATGVGADLATAPTAPMTTPGAANIETLLWVSGGALLAALLVFGATFAWRYRGPLFAWLPEPVKDWFEGRGIVLGRRVRT